MNNSYTFLVFFFVTCVWLRERAGKSPFFKRKALATKMQKNSKDLVKHRKQPSTPLSTTKKRAVYQLNKQRAITNKMEACSRSSVSVVQKDDGGQTQFVIQLSASAFDAFEIGLYRLLRTSIPSCQ